MANTRIKRKRDSKAAVTMPKVHGLEDGKDD